MKKLALLCFRKNGHFMHYTKLVWNAYEGTFDITLFTTEEIAQSEEYKCYFGEIDEKLKKVLVKEGTEREAFKRILASERKREREREREREYDYIFGIHLQEYWLQILPFIILSKFFGPHIKCSGIICQTSFAYPENHLSNFKWIRRFLLRRIATLFFHKLFLIDEIAYKIIFPHGSTKAINLQDPLETPSAFSREYARTTLNLPLNAHILSSIGLMYDTKRLDLLVDAFLGSKPTSDRFLLLAGRFYTSMKKVLEDKISGSKFGKQIILLDKFLTTEEFDLYFCASDYIAVTYDHHYANSSLLLRACQLGKPCLISSNGWPGRFGISHQCGIIVNIHNAKEYTEGIKKLFTSNVMNHERLVGQYMESAFIDGLKNI